VEEPLEAVVVFEGFPKEEEPPEKVEVDDVPEDPAGPKRDSS
jgi:hypothetical protein